MMTYKELIEEMAKEIFNTCAWRFGNPNDYKEIFNDIAEDLTELNYRKIPEDSILLSKTDFDLILPPNSVVLSSEEWKQIKNSLYYSKEELDKKLAKARKETAEEILKEILFVKGIKGWQENKQLVEFCNRIVDKIEELAKQFGVEVIEKE